MSTPSPLNAASSQAEQPAIRILVVDDNPSIHGDFRKILCSSNDTTLRLKSAEATLFGEETSTVSKAAFEVDSAFQGQEGLAKVQQAVAEGHPYVLAFVDIRMPPGWDGVETVDRIWQADPNVQIVICTAYSDYSWEQMSVRFGASDSLVILKKPFDNVEVLQLAHTLSTKWRLTRESKLRIEGLDRAVAERAATLKHSEERFSRAFLASPVPLALQNLATQQFFDANTSFLEMLGYQRAELLDHTPEELSLFVDDQLKTQLLEAARIHAPVRARQCQFRARNGDLRTVLLSVEPIKTETEHYLLLLALDVTEHLKLEIQLRHAQKMEAIGQLAAGVAHDFNNILTVITGHVQLALSRPALDPQLDEALKLVRTAAERAASLTRQLLAFGRKQIINPRPLDLGHLLQNLSRMLRSVLGEHIQLEVDCRPDLPPVFADPGSVEQVIVNLAVNARDAMPNGGRLNVRAECACIGHNQMLSHPDAAAGEFICITVADTGCGMKAETLNHLFEPFFTTKEVGQGTGLGLATAYGIVRQHNGWIEVASEVDKGSTFRVFFPRSKQSAAKPLPSAPLPAPVENKLKGKTILLVEDEATVRALAERMLNRFGYRVLSAASGQEALTVWQQHAETIDLLLTDMVMPGGLSGKELAARLAAERPHLRVIYTSGYSVDFQPGGLRLEEGVNFLAKPYNPQSLAGILERASRDQRN